MFDDIVKALTIQIKADDLTGGTWSKIGDGVKTVWNNVTALNQAWELGARVFDKAWGAMQAPITAISEGGAFAETEAAFQQLSVSMRVDGEYIVNSLLSISSHTEGLERTMQSASNAMRQGFSSAQIDAIAVYAKKYTEAVGGNHLAVMDKIVDAIAQGKAKVLKEFGVMADAGSDVAEILAKMEDRAAAFGRGAFNFGDDWSSMFTSLSNAMLQVKREINSLVEDLGFADFAEGVRNSFNEIGSDSEYYAKIIFTPLYDVAVSVFSAIADPLDVMWDLMFDNSDSFSTQIATLGRMAGNTIYDVTKLFGYAFDMLMAYINSTMVNFLDVVSGIDLQMEKTLGKSIFGKEWRASMTEAIDSINGYSSLYETLDIKQRTFNNNLDETVKATSLAADSNNRFADALRNQEIGLQKVGQGLVEDKVAKKAAREAEKEQEKWEKERDKEKEKREKAELERKKLLTEEVKALSEGYVNLSKSLEGTVKTMSDVVNKTQEGLSKSTSDQIDFIKESDVFAFGTSQKKGEINELIEKQRQQKAQEMKTLEKSSDAQIALAQAYEKYAGTPRKFEITAAGSAQNLILSLAHELIKTIENLSLTENTPVAGVT